LENVALLGQVRSLLSLLLPCIANVLDCKRHRLSRWPRSQHQSDVCLSVPSDCVYWNRLTKGSTGRGQRTFRTVCRRPIHANCFTNIRKSRRRPIYQVVGDVSSRTSSNAARTESLSIVVDITIGLGRHSTITDEHRLTPAKAHSSLRSTIYYVRRTSCVYATTSYSSYANRTLCVSLCD